MARNSLVYLMRAPFASPRQTGAQDRFLPKLRFLDQCREVLRFRQMAYRTEQSYVQWRKEPMRSLRGCSTERACA